MLTIREIKEHFLKFLSLIFCSTDYVAYTYILLRRFKKGVTELFVLTERSQTARYFEKVTLLKKIMNHTLPRNENRCTRDQMKRIRSIIRLTTFFIRLLLLFWEGTSEFFGNEGLINVLTFILNSLNLS